MEYSGLFILSFWKTPQSRVRITNQNCLHCLSFSWSLRIHLVLELLWREWIRSSWLCWRANPAGFPPTTVAAANKLKKILPDVRGKSYTGNTPGSRGERILPCEGRDPDRRPKPQELPCHDICEENVAVSLGSLHIRGGCTGVPHIRGWGHQWFAGVIKRLYISVGRHQRRTTNNQKHTTRIWSRILNVEWKQVNNKGSNGTIIHSS